MFLYTTIEAIVAVIAGILIAVCTKKADGVVYGKLDKIGRITNLILLLFYAGFSFVYLFLGIIARPNYDGFLGILGWIVSVIMASTALICGIGLGLSVAFRKRGKSKLSFDIQFAGLGSIALTIILFFLFMMLGGWGNGFGGGFGGGDLYPWMNNSQNINSGFRDQMLGSQISGIQNSITSGFGDVATALCGGFAGVNAAINGAQNAITQQMYQNTIADLERSFGIQTQLHFQRAKVNDLRRLIARGDHVALMHIQARDLAVDLGLDRHTAIGAVEPVALSDLIILSNVHGLDRILRLCRNGLTALGMHNAVKIVVGRHVACLRDKLPVSRSLARPAQQQETRHDHSSHHKQDHPFDPFFLLFHSRKPPC